MNFTVNSYSSKFLHALNLMHYFLRKTFVFLFYLGNSITFLMLPRQSRLFHSMVKNLHLDERPTIPMCFGK